MARTESPNTSIVLETPGNLDVITNFTELMTAAMANNSIYDIARTNLEDFANTSGMTVSEKSVALAQIYGGMISSMTNKCMDMAFQKAVEDRDSPYKLTKAKQDILSAMEQADKIAADNELTTAQEANLNQDKDIKIIQGWKMQADMVNENGVTAFPTITTTLLPVTSIAGGIKGAQEKQTKATTHAMYAKAYRESGIVTYTIDPSSGVMSGATATSGDVFAGLTTAQTDVAVRQKKGFDDNMLQHVANSSASFMGLLLSSATPDKATTAIAADDASPLGLWNTAISKMNSDATAAV